ncbi:DUF5017 domain-containing protein [Chitinophaga sp. SYP-B3965]|uniref:DUF5017 domain-containing protein n=1 Tax=Chitinophaga sp. SYP-B3965 TaxID=2663120 RepID=UPI00129951A8|nr:DUF5017 domain-containing protein [Chitinophaga sp. SYP-B3965]MRG45800.1 DUF5017 domain-containing protein [Chitinophaga sp. SYP-B3965]
MQRSFIILAGLALMAVACSKTLETTAPTFQVRIDPARLVADTFTYKVGDTTQFLFSGDADNIAFYSGEPGKSYANRKASFKLGKVTLSFSTKAEFGTQTNTLQVLATNKLTALDSATVVNANWTNITSKAALSTSATVVNSGTIDLTDQVSGEKDSLFIAFKYSGVTGSTQRTWTITNYVVNNVLADQTFAVSNLTTDVSFWIRYGNVWNPASARWTATATDLKLTGGAAAAPTNTSWIISRPLYVGQISPDVSVAVKSITDAVKTGYPYKYTVPGVYKATFVAFNRTLDEEKSVIKEVIIKVIP